MKNNFSEREMVNMFIDFFLNESQYKYCVEKKCEGTRIDLIYKNSRFVYACEFKKNNFDKLFKQAVRLKNFFNKVFLCIPNNVRISNERFLLCKKYNIGIIIFIPSKKKFKIIFNPKIEKIKSNIKSLTFL